MASVQRHPQPRAARAAPARKHNKLRNEHELEPEEDDPVMQYLSNKSKSEPFDHCLWFSRGMHHVRIPGSRLHTAVQNADSDEYIAVLGHGGKCSWLLQRVRRVLTRAAPTLANAFSRSGGSDGAANGNVPHVHLCITTKEGNGPKRFDTMSLAEALVWCDHNQLPAYLECCTESDLPFYKARGFKVVQMVEDADEHCPKLHSLWRMPRRTG